MTSSLAVPVGRVDGTSSVASESSPAGRDRGATGPPTPVLIAEDDPNDVLLVERAIRRVGAHWAVRWVSDGDEAVAYLRGEGGYADRSRFPLPAVAVVDLKLPLRSGLEVLAWIRQHPGLKRLPVIMLTSSNQQSDVNAAYALGVNSYVVKPGAPGALREVVELIDRYWVSLNQQPDVDDR